MILETACFFIFWSRQKFLKASGQLFARRKFLKLETLSFCQFTTSAIYVSIPQYELPRLNSRGILRRLPSASTYLNASSTDLHPWSSRFKYKVKIKLENYNPTSSLSISPIPSSKLSRLVEFISCSIAPTSSELLKDSSVLTCASPSTCC